MDHLGKSPSNYFARLKVEGKLIRQRLRLNLFFSAANSLPADLENPEIKNAAPGRTAATLEFRHKKHHFEAPPVDSKNSENSSINRAVAEACLQNQDLKVAPLHHPRPLPLGEGETLTEIFAKIHFS
jgi:hypothetical protein